MIALTSFDQSKKNTYKSLHLEILTDTIYISESDPRASIKVACKNNTDSTLILYGIDGNIHTPPFPIRKMICDTEKINTFLACFVYDNDDKLQASIHYYVNDGTPKTKERLDSLLEIGKVNFRKNTRVMKKSEVIILEKEVNFLEYGLKKGTYYVELVYSSGEKIINYVNESQIEEDKKNNCAYIFKGCIISHKIPLRVS